MAKVVTERPRRGSGNKSNKTGARIRRYDPENEYENHPRRLPVSRRRQYGYDSKEFTDVIGPLRGYLHKQIGRPWDKVNSEICATLDRRGLTGAHIWEHIAWEIDTDCYIGTDKKAYSNDRTSKSKWSGELPIDGLYVDPKTGLIREQVSLSRRSIRQSPFYAFRGQLRKFGIDVEWNSADAARYRIDDLVIWEKRENVGPRPRSRATIWFIHRYEHRPMRVETAVLPSGREYEKIFPAQIVLLHTKQASRKELRDAQRLLETSPF